MHSTTSFLPFSIDLNQPCVVNVTALTEAFATLTDQRHPRGIRYPLAPLLMIALLAKLSGHNRLSALAHWAQLRATALTQLFGLSRPTLPHLSTWSRVFAHALDPHDFAALVRSVLLPHAPTGERPAPGSIIVAIDGKTLRGTIPAGHTKGVHLIAAYLPEQGIVLAQLEVGAKTNEIGAMPTLLAHLDLEGVVVTGDAMQTQRGLSIQIVEQGGDYLWIVKQNQKEMLADIEQVFRPLEVLPGTSSAPWDLREAQVVNGGHGRLEERSLQASSELEGYSTWPYVAQVFRVERRVWSRDGQWKSEVRYGMTSLKASEASAERLLEVVRAEWGIENELHYRRDVTLDEDAGLLRRGHGAQVMASLNNLVIGLGYKAQGTKLNLAAFQRSFLYQLDLALARYS